MPITVTHIPWNGMAFESKESLGRVCLLRHLVRRCQSLSSPCYTALPAGCRSKFHWSDFTPFTEVSPPFPADPLSIAQAEATQPLSALLAIISHRERQQWCSYSTRAHRRTANKDRRGETRSATEPTGSSVFLSLSPHLAHFSSRTIFTDNQTHHSALVSLKLIEDNCQHSVKCVCLSAVVLRSSSVKDNLQTCFRLNPFAVQWYLG